MSHQTFLRGKTEISQWRPNYFFLRFKMQKGHATTKLTKLQIEMLKTPKKACVILSAGVSNMALCPSVFLRDAKFQTRVASLVSSSFLPLLHIPSSIPLHLFHSFHFSLTFFFISSFTLSRCSTSPAANKGEVIHPLTFTRAQVRRKVHRIK